MTHKAASLMLNGFANTFRSVAHAGLEIPGIKNFACTIGTVEKQFGISTEGFIIYLVLCPTCWCLHLPCELSKLRSPFCPKIGCPGILYSMKCLSDGTEKRMPSLILPYIPPSRAIQRMCLQLGKVTQWQHWRRQGDEPGVRPPTTGQQFDAYPHPDLLLHDITDAWGWQAIQAGLECHCNGSWEVHDVDVHELVQQLVAFPNGLMLQMNIDGYVLHGQIALIGAILSLEAGEWNLPGQQKGEEIGDDIGVEDPEDEGEFIDLDVVEDDDACEWEDNGDL